MRNIKSTVALALTLVAGAGFLSISRGGGSAAAAPAAGQFAVVDIGDLITSSPGWKTAEASNRKRKEALQAWDADQAKKVKDLESRYDLLPRADDAGRRALSREILIAGATYEAEKKWQLQKAQSEAGDDLETVYAEVKAVVAKVAKERGYTAVFTKTSEPLRVSRPEEFSSSIAARPLLYWDPNLDITEEVKARMLELRPGVPPPAPPVSGTPPAMDR